MKISSRTSTSLLNYLRPLLGGDFNAAHFADVVGKMREKVCFGFVML